MADLAPRGYGAGAYGSAPYERYSYVTFSDWRGASSTSGAVPFFLVLVLNDVELLGFSLCGALTADFQLVRQLGGGFSASADASLPAQKEVSWAGVGTASTGSAATAEVLLGMALWGEAFSYGQASANAVNISFGLAGDAVVGALAEKTVERLWAGSTTALTGGSAVLSPLWGCQEVKAASWDCTPSQEVTTWEEATVAQSAWACRR